MNSDRYTANSDWEKLAGEYSRWLPMLAPYGDRLRKLCDPQPGMKVLDLACGTGEPGLTLAHHHPQVSVVGADKAHAMAHAANVARQIDQLGNIRFVVASGQRLPFADGSFNRIICRFGLMLFDNPAAGLQEIFRVLQPGGQISLSVWSEPERVCCPALTLNVLEQYATVAWPRTFALSEPGLLAKMCLSAGFGSVMEVPFNPGFVFDDLDHFMSQNLTGRFIETPYQSLSKTARREFETALAQAGQERADKTGRIHLSQEAILINATKP